MAYLAVDKDGQECIMNGAKPYMVSNSPNNWQLRYYASNGKCFADGKKSGDIHAWDKIIPVFKFDFDNMKNL